MLVGPSPKPCFQKLPFCPSTPDSLTGILLGLRCCEKEGEGRACLPAVVKVSCPFVLPLCFPRLLAKAGGLAGLAAELSVLPDSAEDNVWDIRSRGSFNHSALIENPGVVFGGLRVPAGCVVICQLNVILYLGV